MQFPHVSYGKNLEGVSDDDDDDDDGDGSGADPDKDLESDDEGCAPGSALLADGLSLQGVALGGGGAEGIGNGNGVFVSRRNNSISNSSSSRSSVTPFHGVLGDATGVRSTWVNRPRLVLYGPPG